jgi:hypothetical protein
MKISLRCPGIVKNGNEVVFQGAAVKAFLCKK